MLHCISCADEVSCLFVSPCAIKIVQWIGRYNSIQSPIFVIWNEPYITVRMGFSVIVGIVGRDCCRKQDRAYIIIISAYRTCTDLRARLDIF
jgi:hypothetical protein